MIQSAFNSLISSNTLALEEAKVQIRDSVEKEFKQRVQQELTDPENIQKAFEVSGAQNLTDSPDLGELEKKYTQLKDKTNFLEQQVDSKISQIESIKNKVNKIEDNFSKLDEAIKIGNDIIPILKVIVTIAPQALAFFTGPVSNAAAEKKINDGLAKAKSKIKEFEKIVKSLTKIRTYINEQTDSINKQVDPALEALNNIKLQVQQNNTLIDNTYSQVTSIASQGSQFIESQTNQIIDNQTQ